MSVVWRGYDETLGRDVAVKVLAAQIAGDDTFRDRLRQEAHAAARLCHPHITGIFDFGESQLSDRVTVPYVVMELNDGESVAARLYRDGPLPWREAVTVVAEVASALATAHARGVVHRDVTPANVMLTSGGAKVVDFGISALIGQRDAAPDGSLLGTPAYLAPERLAGRPVGPATDVYALGLLLYRMLTARLPWPAANTTEALRAHLYADPEPLPALLGMPADVAGLCLRCLAKEPRDRPAAADVANRLAAVVGLPPVVVDPAPVPVPVFAVPPPPGVPPQRSRRLRTGLRVAGALRMGRVRALGGGVFVGGHATRDLLSGRIVRALVPGRHRLQAAGLTVMLLVVLGGTWASSREPAQVGPAQAVAAGPGSGPGPAGVLHQAGCKVRYQVERDSGSDFEARLTVVNTGGRALEDWRMEFAYPGSQRLTTPADAVTQNGRRIIVRGGRDLGAGRSVVLVLRGAYRSANPLPLVFRVDGHLCRAEVLGATTVPVAEKRPARTKSKRGTSSVRKPSAPSTESPESPAGPRSAPPAVAPAAPQSRSSARPPAPAAPPPAPSRSPRKPAPGAEPRRVGGFSVSV
jgi:serine/threonine-protein kinase